MNSKLILMLLIAVITLSNFSFSLAKESCNMEQEGCCCPAEDVSSIEVEITHDCECTVQQAPVASPIANAIVKANQKVNIQYIVSYIAENIYPKHSGLLISLKDHIPIYGFEDIYLLNSNIRI